MDLYPVFLAMVQCDEQGLVDESPAKVSYECFAKSATFKAVIARLSGLPETTADEKKEV